MKAKFVFEFLDAYFKPETKTKITPKYKGPKEYSLDINKFDWSEKIEPQLKDMDIPYKKRGESIWKDVVHIIFPDEISYGIAKRIVDES